MKRACLTVLSVLIAASARAGSPRTSAADFLEIPAGARGAALGGAYGALAHDAWAPLWNPAGLGLLKTGEFAVTHLSWLESIDYETGTLGVPLPGGRGGLGAAFQYLSPGSVEARDAAGQSLGSFDGWYGAGTLAYGKAISDGFSLGAGARFVRAEIDEASAQSQAFDLGAMYKPAESVSLGAAATNLGGRMGFTGAKERLAELYRVGGAWRARRSLLLSLDGTRDRSGRTDAHFGAELAAYESFALRGGWASGRSRDLGGLAGLSMGGGLKWRGFGVDYAWVPMGDLGMAHFFTLTVALGKPAGAGSSAAPSGPAAPAP